MAASYLPSNGQHQWLFPVSALEHTPSARTMSIEKELSERARGIEFLFRLGTSLHLHTAAMFTAATWFHRFYMRFPIDEYHRQDVAAACIFLSTKTEECGRKLRDVAKVTLAKIHGNNTFDHLSNDSPEVEECQAQILHTEEALLEALCFDFVTQAPHEELLNLFDNFRDIDEMVVQYAWSLAHDSYRTPLCLLYSPRIIAAACYVLAQRLVDGPLSPTLDARIAAEPPSTSLPTPPTHKAASPDASRLAVDYFKLDKEDLVAVADTLSILLEFYRAQDVQDKVDHLADLAAVAPPSIHVTVRPHLYAPAPQASQQTPQHSSIADMMHSRTPNSSHGGSTPSHVAASVESKPSPSKGHWKPVAAAPT